MRIKSGRHGVDIRYTHPTVLFAANILHEVWKEMFPKSEFPHHEFVISGGNEGKHKTGSRHYLGLALDFRTKDPQGKWTLTDEERLHLLREGRRRVGDEFDLTISNPDSYQNLHLELDPKENLR